MFNNQKVSTSNLYNMKNDRKSISYRVLTQNTSFQNNHNLKEKKDSRKSVIEDNKNVMNIFSKLKIPHNLQKQSTGIKNYLFDFKNNLENDIKDLKENLPFKKEIKKGLIKNSLTSVIGTTLSPFGKKLDIINTSTTFIEKRLTNEKVDKNSINNNKSQTSELKNSNNENISDHKFFKTNSLMELTHRKSQRRLSYNSEKGDDINLAYNEFPKKMFTASEINKGYNILKEKISDNINIDKEDQDLLNSENKKSSNIQINITENLELNNDFEEDISMPYKINRELLKFNNVYDSLSFSEEIIEPVYSEILINPNGTFKRIWDFFMLIMIFYSIIITPYLLCFIEIKKDTDFSIEYIVDSMFILDFCFNFITPYYDKEENLITNLVDIIINYLENWFLYDLLTCIPFSFISYELILIYPVVNRKYHHNVKLVLCLQWVRLLRILKLDRNNSNLNIIEMNNFEETRLFRLLRFLLYFTLVIHVTSCLWIFIGKIDYDIDNWIDANGLNDGTHFDIYIASFYYNLVTIYTIGYGDVIAKNLVERLYMCVFMSVGVILFSFTISNFSTFLTITDKKTIEYNNKLEIFSMIDKEHFIPKNLYKKIKGFLSFSFKNSYDERYHLLESLPTKIKNDLTIFMYKNHIKELNFFKEQSNDFILFVLPMLKTHNVKKGDTLFSVGEFLEEMYMIIRGSLSLTLSNQMDNIEICQIRSNQHFGELFIETNEQSPYELKGKSKTTEMLVLKKNDYLSIKNVFSENIVKILKNSFLSLEKIDKKKKIILELLKYDDNPGNVKKFMKIINKEMMIKDFDDYYNNGTNFGDDVEFLLKNKATLTKIFTKTFVSKNTDQNDLDVKSNKQSSRKMNTIIEEDELSCSININKNYSIDNSIKESETRLKDNDLDKKLDNISNNTYHENKDKVNTIYSNIELNQDKNIKDIIYTTAKDQNIDNKIKKSINELIDLKYKSNLSTIYLETENKNLRIFDESPVKETFDNEYIKKIERSKTKKQEKSKIRQETVNSIKSKNNYKNQIGTCTNTKISELMKKIDFKENNFNLLKEQKEIQIKAKSLLKYDTTHQIKNANTKTSFQPENLNKLASLFSDEKNDNDCIIPRKKVNDSDYNSFIIINNNYYNKGPYQKNKEYDQSNLVQTIELPKTNENNLSKNLNSSIDLNLKYSQTYFISSDISFNILNSYDKHECRICVQGKKKDILIKERAIELEFGINISLENSSKKACEVLPQDIVKIKDDLNMNEKNLFINSLFNSSDKKRVSKNLVNYSGNNVHYLDEVNFINVDQALKKEIELINQKFIQDKNNNKKINKANKKLDVILGKIEVFKMINVKLKGND